MAVVTYSATGRRKSSVARVRLVPGEGKIVINGRELTNYFGLKTLELIVNQPLEITETKGKYDVLVSYWRRCFRSGRCDPSWYRSCFARR